MLADIKSLTWEQTLLAIVAFLGLIAPGFLIVYQFKLELFLQLEFLKLSVFSLAITMPVFIVSLIVLAFMTEYESEDAGENVRDTSTASLLLTFLVFYPAIFAAYWFQFSFAVFTVVVIAAFPITHVAAIALDRGQAKRNAKNGSQT